MNIFKMSIPKDKAQEVTELESWTVAWTTFRFESLASYGRSVTYHKVFINQPDADEFERQLKESAKFLGCHVETKKYKN
jgi:hypothetical protein